jgi:cytoplasmic iron level regulating protein YaaA (DUF328/UPF0246 family)
MQAMGGPRLSGVLILLPPSEGKTAPRRGRRLDLDLLSFPGLNPGRRQVLDALVELCTADSSADAPVAAAATLGLGSTQLSEVARNAGLDEAYVARADRVYAGVLYEALDLAGLDAAVRRRASRSLLVTSALFGLVRPTDPIPAYRLSGDVTLPGVGKVSAHWRSLLGPVVEGALGRGLLVDLRSSTYAAFWRPPEQLAARVATVRVLHEHGGRRKVVSHFNKATKGRLVRSLLEEGRDARTPAGLADLLTDLGWKVESGEPTPHGIPLDVVVTEL